MRKQLLASTIILLFIASVALVDANSDDDACNKACTGTYNGGECRNFVDPQKDCNGAGECRTWTRNDLVAPEPSGAWIYYCGGDLSTSSCYCYKSIPCGGTLEACQAQCKDGGDCSLAEKCAGKSKCADYGSDIASCTANTCKVGDGTASACKDDGSGNCVAANADECTGITDCASYATGVDEATYKTKCTDNKCSGTIGACEWDDAAKKCNPKAAAGGGGTTTEEESYIDKALADIKAKVQQIAYIVYCLVLMIVGGIVALVIIMSGIKWMTSDEESGRAEAKRRVAYSVAALIIVVLACPIVNFLFSFSGSPIGQIECDCSKSLAGSYGGGGTTTGGGAGKTGSAAGQECIDQCKAYNPTYVARCYDKCEGDITLHPPNLNKGCTGAGKLTCCCKEPTAAAGSGSGTKCANSDKCYSNLFCANMMYFKAKDDKSTKTESECVSSIGIGVACDESWEDKGSVAKICKDTVCKNGYCVASAASNFCPAPKLTKYCEDTFGSRYCDKTQTVKETAGGPDLPTCQPKKDSGACAGLEASGKDDKVCVSDWCVGVNCGAAGDCAVNVDCTRHSGYGNYYCKNDGKCMPKEANKAKCGTDLIKGGTPDEMCSSGLCISTSPNRCAPKGDCGNTADCVRQNLKDNYCGNDNKCTAKKVTGYCAADKTADNDANVMCLSKQCVGNQCVEAK